MSKEFYSTVVPPNTAPSNTAVYWERRLYFKSCIVIITFVSNDNKITFISTHKGVNVRRQPLDDCRGLL